MKEQTLKEPIQMVDNTTELEAKLEIKVESVDDLINELWFLVQLGVDNLSESQQLLKKLIAQEIWSRAKAKHLFRTVA